MRRNFTFSFSWIITIALAITMNFALAARSQDVKPDTINYSLNFKKNKKKSPLSFSLPPIKPGYVSSAKVIVAKPDDKLLSDVEVYPNPVTDQINLKYTIARNSNVTVKLMDILGNNVATLFSQRVEPGEQTRNFPIDNTKLSRGFYFIRVVAGTELVIRKISVL